MELLNEYKSILEKLKLTMDDIRDRFDEQLLIGIGNRFDKLNGRINDIPLDTGKQFVIIGQSAKPDIKKLIRSLKVLREEFVDDGDLETITIITNALMQLKSLKQTIKRNKIGIDVLGYNNYIQYKTLYNHTHEVLIPKLKEIYAFELGGVYLRDAGIADDEVKFLQKYANVFNEVTLIIHSIISDCRYYPRTFETKLIFLDSVTSGIITSIDEYCDMNEEYGGNVQSLRELVVGLRGVVESISSEE